MSVRATDKRISTRSILAFCARNGARLLKLGTVATVLLTALDFSAEWTYLGDLAVHFTAFYFGYALLASLLFAAARNWRWLAVSCVPLVINGAGILPYYIGCDRMPSAGAKLSVLTSNVLILNTRYQDVVDYVQSTQPDIMALEEVSVPWLERLAPLREQYPYRIERPLYDNHGIALFSRIPLEDTVVTELADSGIPEIEATVLVGKTKVRVFCLHTVPPRTRAYALARNRMFVALAERVNRWAGPCIVLGDFNCSLWSPHYKRLIRDTDLRNARQGFGILPTWPADTAPFMTPLDHCLHSKEVAVSRCSVGVDIGSDHYPLFADLVVAQ